MPDWWLLGIILVVGLFLLMGFGVPIAFTLGILGLVGTLIFWAAPNPLYLMTLTALQVTRNFALIAVPLFLLMSEVMVFTDLSKDAFDGIQKWVGHLPGGLAISSVVGCSIFAAVTGSSVANTAIMGGVAVPEMIKRGYPRGLATGCVASGGALGILIPPSIPFILYGIMAQQSIAHLFFAGLVPGVLTTFLFAGYIAIRCAVRPGYAPGLPSAAWRDRVAGLWKLWGVGLLVVVVLGGVSGGFLTPTEAAAVGAMMSLVLAFIYRKLTWTRLRKAMLATVQTTSMVLIIFVGGMVFSHLAAYMRIPQELALWVSSLPLSRWLILILIQLMLLGLGCIMDPGSIILICTPIFVPVIKTLGFDPIWFGVLFVINMELANVTPPVGYNLFVMKGVVPDVPLGEIITGIIPFLILFIVSMALVMIWPDLALWLPNHMF